MTRRKSREVTENYDAHFFQQSYGKKVTVEERYGKDRRFRATTRTAFGGQATGTGPTIDEAVMDMWQHHDIVEGDELAMMTARKKDANTDPASPVGDNGVRDTREGDGEGPGEDPGPEPDPLPDREPPDTYCV